MWEIVLQMVHYGILAGFHHTALLFQTSPSSPSEVWKRCREGHTSPV